MEHSIWFSRRAFRSRELVVLGRIVRLTLFTIRRSRFVWVGEFHSWRKGIAGHLTNSVPGIKISSSSIIRRIPKYGFHVFYVLLFLKVVKATTRIVLRDLFKDMKSPELVLFDMSFNPSVPQGIKLGNINQDGYPDLLFIL